MQRPMSIVNFERCYLGSVAAGLIAVLLNEQSRQRLGEMFRQTDAAIGGWYAPAVLAVSVLIPVVLWYFAARRASVVAKWIIVVFFAFNCLGFVASLAMGTHQRGLVGVLSFLAFALDAVAVWLLFKPDARAWFGEPPIEDGREVRP